MITCLVTRRQPSAGPGFAIDVLRRTAPGKSRRTWEYSKDLKSHGISIAVIKAYDFHVTPVHEDKRYIYIVSGYFSGLETGFFSRDKSNFAKHLAKAVEFRHGVLRLTRRLGGIFTCIVIDKTIGTICAFSSMPALRPVFYGHTGGVMAIGDRPYGVALGLNEAVPFADSFVSDYIGCSYSLDNTTPFANVYRTFNGEMVAASDSIHCRRGPDRPLVEVPESHTDTKVAAALVKSLSALKYVPNVEVRVSGGKDSRTVLAALANTQIPYVPVIFSRPGGDEESRAAEMLCRIAGKNLAIRQPSLPQQLDEIVAGVDTTLRRMDGLIHTEPRQAAYSFPRLFDNSWGARILGHAHLQRGGFARNMRNDPETIRTQAKSHFVSDFLATEAKRVNEERIAEFAAGVSLKSHVELLYLVNAHFRVSHYLAPHYLYERCDSLPCYPLLDQEFVDLIDAIPMADKVSELMIFNTIRKLKPAFAKVPLAGKRWRFESTAPRDGVPGYELRDPTGLVASDAERSENSGSSRFIETWVPEKLMAAMLEMIRDSGLYDEIEERLNPDSRKFFQPDGERRINSLRGNPRKAAMQFFWMVFCITRSHERTWTTTSID